MRVVLDDLKIDPCHDCTDTWVLPWYRAGSIDDGIDNNYESSREGNRKVSFN